MAVYLLHDEYIDSQNKQNLHLHREFQNIHHSIDQVNSELKGFKNDVNKEFQTVRAEFQELRAEFQELRADFQELRAENMRTSALLRNNNLHNPILPIRPLVAFHPERGIIEPDSKYFPKHAKEFYSLKSPTSKREHDMLAYLADFYDVPYHRDSQSSVRGCIVHDPALVVEQLEPILGLHEDRFVQFHLKAQQSEVPQSNTKRSHFLTQMSTLQRPTTKPSRMSLFDGGHKPILPQAKIPYFPQDVEEDDASLGHASEETRLGWRIGSSTSHGKRQHELLKAEWEAQAGAKNDNEKMTSNAGTITNPNTSSQEPSEAQEE